MNYFLVDRITSVNFYHELVITSLIQNVENKFSDFEAKELKV